MAAGTDAEKREARQQIVSFENQPKKHQKAAGLRSAALSFQFFRRLPIFSKDQSGVCGLRAHSANLNSFNRVSESYCRGFCIKQVLRYQVLEEIHRNGN